MIQKIKTAFTALLLSLTFAAPVMVTVPAYADYSASKSAACDAISLAGDSSSDCSGGADTRVNNLFNTIVTILSVIVGVAAVIMIIVSGFRYITSGGDSNKVSSAKSALIYAIVGLVIVAVAQFIVHFVLQQV